MFAWVHPITLYVLMMPILQLITYSVLVWAFLLLWKRTRHWPYIIFLMVLSLQLLEILSLNFYRNFVLWKATVEEVEQFNRTFSHFEFGLSSMVGVVSFILVLIAGIGIVVINYNRDTQ